MKRYFENYDFALSYMLQGEDKSHIATELGTDGKRHSRTHDLNSIMAMFNFDILTADTGCVLHHDLNPDGSPVIPDGVRPPLIDSVDIIFTRTGNDDEWTTLVSWSRYCGYQLLPELPQEIMSEVLNSIIYYWMEKVG